MKDYTIRWKSKSKKSSTTKTINGEPFGVDAENESQARELASLKIEQEYGFDRTEFWITEISIRR